MNRVCYMLNEKEKDASGQGLMEGWRGGRRETGLSGEGLPGRVMLAP